MGNSSGNGSDFMDMDHGPLRKVGPLWPWIISLSCLGGLVKPWGNIFCTALELHIAGNVGCGSLAMPFVIHPICLRVKQRSHCK